jgi:hypothetical protein
VKGIVEELERCTEKSEEFKHQADIIKEAEYILQWTEGGKGGC